MIYLSKYLDAAATAYVLKSKEVPVNCQTNNYEDRGGHETVYKEVLEVGPENIKMRSIFMTHCQKRPLITLFVFLIADPQQNDVSLLTPVSDSVFIALSDGTIHFAPHGSLLNHNLIG